MCYKLLKKMLFRLDPETAHEVALHALKFLEQTGLSKIIFSAPAYHPQTLMGLTFPNPVGLAAGFDKNGDYIDALAALGFGFIEVGTITPKAQEGNPKPRLFRLKEQEAIINRLGFNNKGVDHLVSRLEKMRYKGILGINLGKNRKTPLEQATSDYLYSFRRLAPFASYITINISSPNTPELRQLQHGELLRELLHSLKAEQAKWEKDEKKYLPLVLKIAPDLSTEELASIAKIMVAEKIDGVIATNTTISRDGVKGTPHAEETGGLSGKPLSTCSTALIKNLSSLLQNKIPIIASGGVVSKQDALEKLAGRC